MDYQKYRLYNSINYKINYFVKSPINIIIGLFLLKEKGIRCLVLSPFPIEKDNHFLQVCRYIERNPLRAGLVKKAEDWRWSSLWTQEKGTDRQKLLLSPWPVEKPNTYLKWVNTLQKDEEEKLEKIRHSIKRGSPFGEDNWIKTIAKKLGLISTLNPRGRPKKGT